MKQFYTLPIILFTTSTIASAQIILDSIPDGSGYTYIASPTGPGPFPAVLYNHGGLGTSVGGDLRGTAIALAQAGYFARCEKRMETVPITGHLQEVENTLDSLRADARADTSCVSIMGFSRGGYLTLEAAKQNPGKVHSIISMAPANPNNLLDTLVADVSPIDDPVLMLVASNDTLVTQTQMVYDSLIAGGKAATLIIYPGYDSNGDSIVDGSDDGHELFFVVQNPYWADVINFLNTNCSPGGVNNSIEEIQTIKIFPNPFSSTATLFYSLNENSQVKIEVYNLLGEKVLSLVYEKQNAGNYQINFSTKENGVYLLRMKVGQKIFFGKIIHI